MDLLDVILLVIISVYAVRGFVTGFLRQVGSLAGFTLGVVLGALLSPFTVGLAKSTGGKAIITLITVLGAAAILGALGEKVGSWLAGFTKKLHIVLLDEIAGSVLSAASILVLAWVLTSIFARLPFQGISQQIQDSAILSALDQTLPPVPDVIARVESAITPGGFPRVFAGIEPQAGPPVADPNQTAVNAAATAGTASTVKIAGTGCGGYVFGSGFIVAPGLVVTNAHVVAGIAKPYVVDGAGEHASTVVSFDPNLDIAVLRTSGLVGPVLPLSGSEFPRGTVGAVLGYPGGGNFNVQPAAILFEQTAIGRNIFDRGVVNRQIYALQSLVRPGNSGGPLITPNGTVIGVVFAASTTSNNVGYALTSSEIRSEVAAAAGHSAVSSGTECAVE